MTIDALLAEGAALLRSAGVPDPARDAALLLEHALGADRAWLRARGEEEVPEEARAGFGALLARRAAHEPFAYIAGWAPFAGLRLRVTPAVLIPRPETEELVEHILARLPAGKLRIADVGTGSGAIALALAHARPEAEVLGVDVSPEALAVAEENGRSLGVPNVAWALSDLLAGTSGAFDLIVANLPYLTAGEMRALPRDLAYEPALALAGGADGNALVRRLLAEAPARLAPKGRIVLELHPANARAAAEEARRRFPGADVTTLRDLAGAERFVWIETG